MKSKQLALVAMLVVLTSTTAYASSNLCNVPEAQRQPIKALQQKLEGAGWKIKKMKTDRGCYEVYATTERGQRVEAYFNPQTFELVKKQ